MAQFPHVPWPRMAYQPRLGGLAQALGAHTVDRPIPLEEGTSQHQEIVSPLAQGRQLQHHHRQPVV
ncbi:MAG TPA: hypothetical protein VGC20_06310, partial [bacterium]